MAAAACIAETADAHAGKGLNPDTEAIIRKHYKAWVDKDWHTEDMLLADDFTFSSAAGDDHISKSVFKTRCWDNNAKDIKKFDLVRIFGSGNEALVLYDCLTMDDKTIQNVEYFQLRDGKVASLTCYFGAPSNYPAAVSAGRK
jgi:ketosteroid isomerase-like protein